MTDEGANCVMGMATTVMDNNFSKEPKISVYSETEDQFPRSLSGIQALRGVLRSSDNKVLLMWGS